jgi:O-antigen/teichoic acid export membrane protein
MELQKNIFKNASAGIFNKVSNSLIRFLQVPLLIHFLGVEDFGRWTVLYTIPAWLTFTNFGFGSVGANEMSIYVSQGKIKDAQQVFSTIFVLIFGIFIIGLVLCILIIPIINWEDFLKSDLIRHNEFSNGVLWLCLSVFVSFFNEAFLGIYRAAHKAHLAILLSSILPWLNLLGFYISLNFSRHFDFLAFSLFLSNLIFVIFYGSLGIRIMPHVSFAFSCIDISKLKYLYRKGIAFQAFPLGNALVIQGNVLIIQFLLGPVFVAMYSTAKTLVNTVKQFIDIINQASWPELSHLIGARDFKQSALIHRNGLALSIIISVLGFIFLSVFGEFIYKIWVGKSILLPYHLLLIFLLAIPFNALWFTSSVVHLASNNHSGLAARYIIAAIFSSLACFVLTYFFKLEGAAISVILMDILLIPYVIRHSLLITDDNWDDFVKGTFQLIFKMPTLMLKRLSTIS